jgi:hypothetical protein
MNEDRRDARRDSQAGNEQNSFDDSLPDSNLRESPEKQVLVTGLVASVMPSVRWMYQGILTIGAGRLALVSRGNSSKSLK